MVVGLFFRFFSFLSSLLGTLLLIFALYFFFGFFLVYPSLIGLVIIMFIVFFTRTSFSNIRKFRSFARHKGMSRGHARSASKAIQNRFFSGHIARAFLIGFMVFRFEYFLIVPAVVFCGLVIIAMMSLRKVSLPKIVFSAILGTVSGVVGVILSKFLF